MADDFSFYDISSMPYVMITDGKISQIGYSFINLTGYSGQELMGFRLIDVCREKLRMQLDENDLLFPGYSKDVYLFTKELEAREVTFSLKEAIFENEKICVFTEKPGSRLEDKCPYLYQMYLDNIHGIALYSVPDLYLLKANEQYIKVLCEPYNSYYAAIGKQIGELFSSWSGSEFEEICNTVLITGSSHNMNKNELDIFKKEDTSWSCMLTPVKEAGKVKYLVKCCSEVVKKNDNNISKEKHSNVLATLREPLLWEKEKLENTLKRKDEYFSFLSHEFKTPLTVINSAIQAMETICGDELSDKSRKYIDKIRQNVFRQLRLVNNILDITKAESDKITINERNIDIVYLSGAIVDSVLIYAQEKEIDLQFSSDVPSRIISIDDEKYERILLNLLSNAIKYTPKGKSVFVRLFLKDNRVHVGVKDEGIGIPESKKKTVFERFGQIENSLTRKSGGTGIGLTFVKFLLDRMNGEITLQSTEGKGSTFTISIPDKHVIQSNETGTEYEITDTRLIHLADIEFSDIY